MSAKNNSESNFLGTGWSFPPTFNKNKKSVQMLSGEADILSSLEILFTTRIGERMMRANYGSRVPNMVFDPLGSSEKALLREHIILAIRMYEPRIKPVEVTIDVNALEGIVTIALEFDVITTNNRHNFVYPFYILEGTEVRK
jgi:uncharacterized protein